MDDDPRRRGLRAGFDNAAEDYQRTRPVCPPQLFDDLIDRAGLRQGNRVIEIGCGTGQATVPLAQRGLAVTAVELGAELAAIARRRLAAFPSAEVVTCSFEDWQPYGAPADAVVAVNCLHWIDPQLRYSRPYELLRPGGAMAVAGCLWARPAHAERFWSDVQEDYRVVGFEGSPPPPPEQIGPQHFPPEAAGFFEELASLQGRQLREQQDQQAGFASGKLVQHNRPPRPFVTIGILAIQIVTERPWPYAGRNKTAIDSPLSQASPMPSQRSQPVTAPHKLPQNPEYGPDPSIQDPSTHELTELSWPPSAHLLNVRRDGCTIPAPPHRRTAVENGQGSAQTTQPPEIVCNRRCGPGYAPCERSFHP